MAEAHEMHHQDDLSTGMHTTIAAMLSAMGGLVAQHANVPLLDTCLVAFFGGLAAYVGKGAVDVVIVYCKGIRDDRVNQARIRDLSERLEQVTRERNDLLKRGTVEGEV